MKIHPSLPALVVSLLLGACATDSAGKQHLLEEIDARHATEKARFEELQAAFARRWKTPFDLEFPGVGTITVLDCELEGYEGDVELRLHYTYYNSSGTPIRGVRIAIDLVDPESGGVRTEETRLHFPPLIPFAPDSSFTTAASIPLRGLHLRKGWEWRIRPELVAYGVR